MALDTSRTWRLLMVLDIDRGPVPDPAEVDRRARTTLEAITDSNCVAIVSLAHRDIGIAAADSPEQACQQVLSSDVALALSVHPRFRLQPRGRGRNFTIYGLDLGEDGYFTVLMARSPLKRVPGRPVRAALHDGRPCPLSRREPRSLTSWRVRAGPPPARSAAGS